MLPTPEPSENDSQQADSPEPDESDDDFLMSSSGMTMGRFRRLQEAERRGEPLDLDDEEQAQYAQTKIEVAELSARLRTIMNDTFEPYNERLKKIIRDSLPKVRVDLPAQDISPGIALPQQPQPSPAQLASPVDTEWLESIAETAAEKATQDAEREAENSRNIGRMAAVAQDMLATLSDQKDLLDEQKAASERQSKTDTRRHRQNMLIMAATLVVALATLVATLLL